MNYIPQNLRYLRKLANLSQQAFAEQVGLNRGNIASYEKGLAEPNSSNLLKITKYFQVNLVDFIDRDLSVEVEDEQISVSMDDNHHLFSKETLGQIMESDMPEEQLNSAQVLAERSFELNKILEGFKSFHEFNTGRIPEDHMNSSVKRMMVDYERIMEIAEDLQDINRQLIRIIANV